MFFDTDPIYDLKLQSNKQRLGQDIIDFITHNFNEASLEMNLSLDLIIRRIREGRIGIVIGQMRKKGMIQKELVDGVLLDRVKFTRSGFLTLYQTWQYNEFTKQLKNAYKYLLNSNDSLTLEVRARCFPMNMPTFKEFRQYVIGVSEPKSYALWKQWLYSLIYEGILSRDYGRYIQEDH